MILVAGGTGRLGSILVPHLVEQGQEVRVLTRDPGRARHLQGTATDVVVGDVRDPASLESAVTGVTTVVSAVHGFAGPGRVTPRSVDRDGNANLVRAATEVDADMVLVSVVGASTDSPMELFRAKAEAEQHLRASTLAWTIVRSTAFIELWADLLSRNVVLGRGDNPINFVSVHDVAAVVERAVIDPGWRGRVVEVGGPQDLTCDELARLGQASREHPATIRHVPRWVLRTLAPVVRPAAAALAMDTTDMAFDAGSRRSAFADLPFTDARTALAATAAVPVR